MAKRKKAARKATRRASTRRASMKASGGRRRGAGAGDAIALLKADHRQVEGWFSQFEKTRSSGRKLELARNICNALKAHTQIEEELFYPAFLEATGEKDLHHEAEVEHNGAKKLIAEIEGSSPDDEYYDARVSVLSEMIKHHVKEEEQRGGMFAKARESDMDLAELGQQLQARKSEIMGEQGGGGRGGRRMSRDNGIWRGGRGGMQNPDRMRGGMR